MPRISLGTIGLALALAALGAKPRAEALEPLTFYKGKTVAAWIAAVKRPSGRFNSEAIRVIRELGPDARAAVPVLIEALNDEKVSWEAADALGSIGPDAKDAVPALIALIRKRPGLEANGPCQSLSRIGKPAIPTLKEAMTEEDIIGEYAASALGDMGEAGMTTLIDALGDQKEWVRVHAARAMANMNPGPIEALDQLTKALMDRDKTVRRAAAEALRAVGADAKVAVPALRRALKDEATEVRVAALGALGSMGVAAKFAVPDLIETLQDQSTDVRAAAIEALGKVGPGTKVAQRALVGYLHNKEFPQLQAAAIGALAHFGEDALPLTELLKDKEKSTRWGAALALAESHPALAAPALGQILKNPDARAGTVAEALGLIGKAAVPVLIDALDDENEEVRCSACQLLADFGPAARAAVPVLVGALKDKRPAVRLAVGNALSRIDPANRAAVEPLVALVKGTGLGRVVTYKDIYQRFNAAKALGRYGRVVAPVLVEALDSADPWARAAALCALGDAEPGTKSTVAVLVKHLADKEAEVRRCAVLILADSVPPADVVGPLTAALNDDNSEVRGGAALALGRIGLPARAAGPALVAALMEPYAEGPRWFSTPEFVRWGDPVTHVRGNAAYALGRIGKGFGPATGALVAALADERCEVRLAAAWALGQVAPDPKTCVRPLTAALLDNDSLVRACAAQVLGEMGPEARAAVPQLADAVIYGDAELKACAAWALGRIGPDAQLAIPALRRFLNTSEPPPRRMDYGHQTGYIEPQLPPWGPVKPELARLVKHEARNARSEAAAALQQIECAAARRMK